MEKCPDCESKNISACEYAYTSPEHYDGVSEWHCEDCGYRQGRWSGKELKEGEIEPRLGGKKGES